MPLDQRSLQLLLTHNVPIFGALIRATGGVKSEDLEWLTSDSNGIDHPKALMERGDEWLLYPKDEETIKRSLFTFVKAIALMSFFPGGIRIFDIHFTSEADDFIGQD